MTNQCKTFRRKSDSFFSWISFARSTCVRLASSAVGKASCDGAFFPFLGLGESQSTRTKQSVVTVEAPKKQIRKKRTTNFESIVNYNLNE
ncbi:hypothetical protein LEP1GSC127_1405 [Leptospira kirschneri str. 200801925]|nr:hypothetical protein LEP1GSC127_1405 [Leptospira kirschneri str. 200801925]